MLRLQMVDISLAPVNKEWLDLFGADFLDLAKKVESIALTEAITPSPENLFKNFSLPPSKTKVLILGQDPYPKLGVANGLAFSVGNNHELPRSLQNIFKELQSDLGGTIRNDGNLQDWHNQGVSLLNVNLTTRIGEPLAHKDFGWEFLTEKVIKHLAAQNVVALLMGKHAAKYSHFFELKVVTAHPSPLSASRGFFGSKPFSKVNSYLEKSIKW